MKRTLPLFPTSLIGSMPRSKEVLSALRMMRRGTIEQDDFNKLIERETQNVIKLQEDLGIDIITMERLDGIIMCPLFPIKLVALE